ncbi:MAG: hypothetical protein ABIJ39_08440 [Chloroflexota bacterium]
MINRVSKTISFLVFSIALLVGLSGCAPYERISRQYIRALTSGNAQKALDVVCSEGITIAVAIPMDWSDDHYVTTFQSETSARVRVLGKVQIIIRDLEIYLEEAKKYYPDLPIPDLSGLDPQIGIQVGIDFDGVYLKYDDIRKTWCIENNKTMSAFVTYLVTMFTEELGELTP